MAGFHQSVVQGAQGVGFAGAGQSEGQDVDAVLHETALGQMVQLLAQRQGHPVVLEGLPGLAQRQPGFTKQPDDASLAAVLGLLLQRLKQGRPASPWPASVKREVVSAATVGSLNWWHSWPMRSCTTRVSVFITHTPPPLPDCS